VDAAAAIAREPVNVEQAAHCTAAPPSMIDQLRLNALSMA
jgi:hypothetical protein